MASCRLQGWTNQSAPIAFSETEMFMLWFPFCEQSDLIFDIWVIYLVGRVREIKKEWKEKKKKEKLKHEQEQEFEEIRKCFIRHINYKLKP